MDDATQDGEGTDQSTEKRKPAGSPSHTADGIRIFNKSQQWTKKVSRLQPPAGMSPHKTPSDKVTSARPLQDWLEDYGRLSLLGLDATPSPSKDGTAIVTVEKTNEQYAAMTDEARVGAITDLLFEQNEVIQKKVMKFF